MTEVELEGGKSAAYGFMTGMELRDHEGRSWIVVGVHSTTLGLKKSTWWRRLWWRLRVSARRLFA